MLLSYNFISLSCCVICLETHSTDRAVARNTTDKSSSMPHAQGLKWRCWNTENQKFLNEIDLSVLFYVYVSPKRVVSEPLCINWYKVGFVCGKLIRLKNFFFFHILNTIWNTWFVFSQSLQPTAIDSHPCTMLHISFRAHASVPWCWAVSNTLEINAM